jgi:hypothetical protein
MPGTVDDQFVALVQLTLPLQGAWASNESGGTGNSESPPEMTGVNGVTVGSPPSGLNSRPLGRVAHEAASVHGAQPLDGLSSARRLRAWTDATNKALSEQTENIASLVRFIFLFPVRVALAQSDPAFKKSYS